MSRPSCEDVQGWIVDALAAGPPRGDATAATRGAHAAARSPAVDARIEQHVAECAACAEGRRELLASWATFRDLPPLEPPGPLRRRTESAVLELLAEESRGAVHTPWLEASRVPLAVASALVVVAATLLALGFGVGPIPATHVFFCAAIFTGLLVAAFSWIYSATTVNGVHLDGAARVGVLALAITVAATTMCPEFHVLSWWDRSSPGQWLSGAIGEGGSSLVFGFAYGVFPGFLAALFGGRMLAERPVANALVAAVVVFLLATPVIYLQSAPFTSGVIASWVAGIAAGTLCGVGSAFRVRRRVTGAVA